MPIACQRRALWLYVPLLGFIAVALLLFRGIRGPDPTLLPSALVSRPAPLMTLEDLGSYPRFAPNALGRGVPSLVVFFASWCAPCIAEADFLMSIVPQAAQDGFQILGISYKDDDTKAQAFLKRYGNPYTALGADKTGRVAIDWGVYGVPESFVVDGNGIILYRHAGALNKVAFTAHILPFLLAARRGP